MDQGSNSRDMLPPHMTAQGVREIAPSPILRTDRPPRSEVACHFARTELSEFTVGGPHPSLVGHLLFAVGLTTVVQSSRFRSPGGELLLRMKGENSPLRSFSAATSLAVSRHIILYAA